MRTIVIKDAINLQTLSSRLVSSTGNSQVALDSLQSLNPHVNFSRIEPGTVLIVPDTPNFRGDASASVEGGTFDELSKELQSMVDAAGARVLSGYDALLTDQKDVTAVLKLAAVKRAIESDAGLKADIDAAGKVFKQDQVQAKAASQTVKAMTAEASAELDGLAKLLG